MIIFGKVTPPRDNWSGVSSLCFGLGITTLMRGLDRSDDLGSVSRLVKQDQVRRQLLPDFHAERSKALRRVADANLFCDMVTHQEELISSSITVLDHDDRERPQLAVARVVAQFIEFVQVLLRSWLSRQK